MNVKQRPTVESTPPGKCTGRYVNEQHQQRVLVCTASDQNIGIFFNALFAFSHQQQNKHTTKQCELTGDLFERCLNTPNGENNAGAQIDRKERQKGDKVSCALFFAFNDFVRHKLFSFFLHVESI